MVASMADKRIHFGVGVMLGFIFVVGGHNGVSHLSSIERYDPHQNQWTVCRPMKEPRTGNNYSFILSFVCLSCGIGGLKPRLVHVNILELNCVLAVNS